MVPIVIRRSLHVTLLVTVTLTMLLTLSGCGHLPADNAANNGILDLKDVDLAVNSVKLQGEWEFYWQQLLTPEQFREELHDASRSEAHITLPSSWNGVEWEGHSLTGEGFATFRLIVNLAERHIGQSIALRMPTIFHSYNLWIDGVLSAEVGQVGTDKESTVPSLATQLIQFQPQSDRVEIIIQVANFHHLRGGITKHIELGNSKALTTKTNLKVSFEMFVAASLFIIGTYHLLLYSQRQRKDKVALYFSIISLMWAIRSLLMGELMLTQWFPNFPWTLQIKIEYFVLYSSTFIFTMYFYHLFKEDSPRWFRVASGTLAAVFCLIVVMMPANIYSQTLLIYQIIIVLHMAFYLYILWKAALKRIQGALFFLIMSVITAIAMVNDFLYFNEWLLVGSTSAIGLFIFTCAQMYLLSVRFARAEANEEKAAQELAEINDKLRNMNENLEQLVLERTRELSDANESLQHAYDQLLRSEEGRKKLLSYITHDLKSPLATMLGYVEAVQDNIKPEKNALYLKYVHDKTVWLHRMIDDLAFLSHLETNQISFNLQSMPIEKVIRDFWDKYEPVIQDAGLHSELKITSSDLEHASPEVCIDPLRIEQALFNLLTNALKFTPEGGTIFLALTYQQLDEQEYAVVSFTDTGIGISPENLNRIFTRNYKYYPPEFEQGSMGSGLGLAITREIVEVHEGKIWATSEGQGGSTFYIALPIQRIL